MAYLAIFSIILGVTIYAIVLGFENDSSAGRR